MMFLAIRASCSLADRTMRACPLSGGACASPGKQGVRGSAGPPDSPCAPARIARTAREHEALMARNMMSNHTCSDRPLPTCKTSIVVTATMIILFKANIQRWRPAAATTKERRRHLFRGFLCIGFEYGECCRIHYNSCLACRCN